MPDLAVAGKQPADWLKPGGAMTRRATGIGHDIIFKPFHSSQERYVIYWETV